MILSFNKPHAKHAHSVLQGLRLLTVPSCLHTNISLISWLLFIPYTSCRGTESSTVCGSEVSNNLKKIPNEFYFIGWILLCHYFILVKLLIIYLRMFNFPLLAKIANFFKSFFALFTILKMRENKRGDEELNTPDVSKNALP